MKRWCSRSSPVAYLRTMSTASSRLSRAHSMPWSAAFRKRWTTLRVLRGVVLRRHVGQPERGHAVVGRAEHVHLFAELAPDSVRLVREEHGVDVDAAFDEQLRRLVVDVLRVDVAQGHAARLEDRRQVGRDGGAIPDGLSAPGRGVVEAGAGERDPALLSRLADERDGKQRQARVGDALEDVRGVGGCELHLAGEQELNVLAAAGRVLDVDVESLLLRRSPPPSPRTRRRRAGWPAV